MSKKELQDMIELLPDNDVDKVYRFLVELMSEGELKPGVLNMVEDELKYIKENGGTRHEDINWK